MRFVLASVPAFGHALPMIKVGQELLSRGHEVFFISGAEVALAATFAGLTYIPLESAKYQSSIDFFEGKQGTASLDEPFVMRQMIDLLPQSFEETERLLLELQPDCVLVDSATYAPAAVCRLHKLSWATSCVFPDMIPTGTCIPLELRLKLQYSLRDPSEAEIRRMCLKRERNLARQFDIQINGYLSRLGIPAPSPAVLNANLSADLILCYTFPDIEHRRSDWPHQVRFVGPDKWETPQRIKESLVLLPPLVYVTLGTFWNYHFAERFSIVTKGLKHFPGQVVVTTGGVPVTKLGPLELGSNFLIKDYIPQWQIIPYADFVVHHGGFGTAMAVLLCGKPSLVLPLDRSDHEMAFKVRALGIGDLLLAKELSPESIKTKFNAIRTDPEISKRAKTVATSLQTAMASSIAADHLIGLASTFRSEI